MMTDRSSGALAAPATTGRGSGLLLGWCRRHPPATASQQVLLYALLLIILLLSVLPSLRLLWQALQGWQQGLDAPFIRMLRSAATWTALEHSLYTSLLGTALALLLGGLFALILTLTDVRGRSLWVFLFMLPMMIPPQVTALSWLQLSGPASPLLNTLGIAPPLGSPQPLYSAEGVALLLGIQHAPLVFLALRTHLLAIPRELIEAARLSGAHQRRVLWDILLPLCRGGLWTGAAIAFVSCLGNFGIPAMLGIPASYYVLPTLIYQKMASFGADMLSDVASLSVLIGVVALTGVALQNRIQRQQALPLLGMAGRALDFRLGRWRPWTELALALILLLILLLPLLALITSSLVPALGVPLNWHSLTFAAYQEMLSHQGATLRALGNSLLLSTVAALLLMLISLPLAYLLARRQSPLMHWLHAAIDVPYALPGVVLAIACILLFARPLPWLNISLYGSLGIILVAYLARFLAVSLKPVHSSMLQLDTALEEAAQLAGAGLLQRLFSIVLPLLAPSAFAGCLLVFLTAVNELTVSALLWSAGNETLGVLIFNLDESGDAVLASAVAVMIVALVAALMTVLNLLGRYLPQGVIPWQR
ncbi:iron ABC transporter permease [Pokkaliibacter plantistimulans]|nr:iron ABC transporter permease [Pokkaliibacter plantistimulans]